MRQQAGKSAQSSGLEGSSTERLKRAYEAGEAVMYEGKFDDPAHPEKTHIKTEVKLTSVRRYDFDQKEYAGEHATEETLHGFTVEGEFRQDVSSAQPIRKAVTRRDEVLAMKLGTYM